MGTGLRGVHLALWSLIFVFALSSWAQESKPRQSSAGNTAEAHLGQGYDALKQDNFDAAVSEFRKALALDPTLVSRAQFPLAVALFESHRLGEARQEFESIRRELGTHPNISYYLGRIDIDESKFGGAVRNLNQAIVKPPFPDTAYYLGFAYFKSGDLPAAEKWLKEAAKANSQDSRAQYQLGMLYHKQGREEESRKALTQSRDLRHTEDNESRLSTECIQKLEQGAQAEARAICEQLYDPNSARKLTILGTIYGQHGHLEDAVKPFDRAAELEPHSPQMQYNLAYTYYQLNQFEAARAPLESALKRWPDLFQLNSLYGAVLLKLGEEVSGYQALARAHQLNPQDAGTGDTLYRVVLELARKQLEAKKYSDSLRYLAEAAQLRPGEPEPHRRMAEVYTLTARTPEADAERRLAERLDSKSADR